MDTIYKILLFSFFCSIAGLGQSNSPTLHFDQLTINDGLSHNTIHCMLQDHYGYVWIGTQNGLNRYDGYSFEVFKSSSTQKDKSEFLGKNILTLFEDSSKNLWVGTAKSGINIRRQGSDNFENLNQDSCFSAIQGHNISSIYEDMDRNIWITTIGAGLLKYNPQENTSRHYTSANSGLTSDLVFDIVKDKYGAVWVATAGIGLNYMKDGNNFGYSHHILPDNPNMNGFRKKLFMDGKYLWLGTEGTGLYRIEIASKEVQYFSPYSSNKLNTYTVKDICKSNDGKLFIATDGQGLSVYDNATQEMYSYNPETKHKNALNSNSLMCLMKDRSGNIWIGTYNGGINIYKPNKTWFDLDFPAYGQSDQFKNYSVLSVAQNARGNVYFGTDGGGLNILDFQNGNSDFVNYKNQPLQSGTISGNVVKSIFEDSNGQIWLGIFAQKVNIYNPETKTFKVFDKANSVWTIAENKTGQLAFGTMGEGLVYYDPESDIDRQFRYNEEDTTGIASNLIMSVLFDNMDRLWVGTADNGFDIWNEANETFQHYTNNPNDFSSLSSNEVRCIFQDSKENVWIGTEGGGVNLWLGEGKFERITEEDGLIANSVMGMTEDENGIIWISTFQGISKYDPNSKAIENFDFRTSQNANQFNQMSILSSKSGKLYFGGTNGLHSIRPEEVKQIEQQPAIIFTGLEVSNKKITVGSKENGKLILDRPIEDASSFELSYLDNSFQISFSAIDFTNLNENHYTYKLEGLEESWNTTKPKQHSVSYTNLDPGNYKFIIKYRESESEIFVIIKSPFHQTLLFKILSTLIGLGFIIGGIIFFLKRRDANYKRQLLRLEKEKLETSVEAKNSKLMFFAVQMAHKNEILTKIKNELKAISDTSDKKKNSLINKLDRELKNENYWEDFNVYFNRVDQHFVKSIQKKYPDLTTNDIRMCSLIRMNLSNKEIASLCNISSRGVEQSKYRLKKRIGLQKPEDLTKFILLYKSEN